MCGGTLSVIPQGREAGGLQIWSYLGLPVITSQNKQKCNSEIQPYTCHNAEVQNAKYTTQSENVGQQEHSSLIETQSNTAALEDTGNFS